MNRRNFLIGAIAAPAIVKAEILMPVTKIWTPSTATLRVIKFTKDHNGTTLLSVALPYWMTPYELESYRIKNL